MWWASKTKAFLTGGCRLHVAEPGMRDGANATGFSHRWSNSISREACLFYLDFFLVKVPRQDEKTSWTRRACLDVQSHWSWGEKKTQEALSPGHRKPPLVLHRRGNAHTKDDKRICCVSFLWGSKILVRRFIPNVAKLTMVSSAITAFSLVSHTVHIKKSWCFCL